MLITEGGINVWVKLTQIKVISSKRLIRKVGSINEYSFSELKAAWIKSSFS